MTGKETKAVLALLRAAYPNFYKNQTREDLLAVVNLWQKQFEEYDGSLVLGAVNALISVRTEGYPPTIGAVKEMAAKLSVPQQMTETEAWALVSKACRNGSYGYAKEFAALPLPVQKAVGRPEQLQAWAQMEAGEVESVVASNFMRAYRAVCLREKENTLLPGFVFRTDLPAEEVKRLTP